jgi:CheY-like chemotaxis protein
MPLAHTSIHPLRVLIVEDNRDGADTLAILLQGYGFEVRVAYTGPDGLAAALEDPPDAVVCDINLPGLDGLTIARRLREALPEKPFLVAVTALREEDLIEPAGRAGFDHYFAKPADPAELGGLLTELAERG